MPSDAYDEFLDRYARSSDGAGTWTTDDLRLMLFSALTFDATDVSISDVKTSGSTEATATNYSPQALDNQTVSESAGTVTFDCDDETFSGIGGATNNTIVGAVLYLHVDGTDANDVALIHVDFPDTATNGGDFTVAFHASGIVTIS